MQGCRWLSALYARRVLTTVLLVLTLAACSEGTTGLPDDDPDSANGAPSVTLSADKQSGQTPLTVNFTATASDPDGNTLFYTWDFGQGTQLEGSSSRTFTYRQAGTFNVMVTVSDGQMSQSATVTVTVSEGTPPEPGNNPPTVDLSADMTEGEAPLSVQFSTQASDPDGDSLSYTLNFGDGATSSSANDTHTYREPGTYTASVTVTDGRGGVASDEVRISIREGDEPPPTDPPGEDPPGEDPPDDDPPQPGNQKPTANFTFNATGLAVQFDGSGSTDPDGSITKYTWTFNDGQSGTGQETSHTYAKAGTYNVKLTVTDNDGATDSETKSVTVQAPGNGGAPAPTITSFSASDTEITSGESVTLSWAISGAVTEVTISPTVGNVTTDPDKKVTVTPTSTTTYTLTARNGSATATATEMVTVDSSNTGPTRIDSFNVSPAQITFGDAVTFTWQLSGSEPEEVRIRQVGSTTPVAEDLVGKTEYAGYKPSDSATYFLEVVTDTNQVIPSVQRRVLVAPAINNFRPSRSQVSPGGDVTLSWTFTGPSPTSARLTGGGLDVAVTGQSSYPVNPTSTTTYRLTASNGQASSYSETTVRIAPTITELNSSEGLTVPGGESTELTWTIVGAEGSRYTLKGPNIQDESGEITSDPFNDSYDLTVPTDPGPYTYTLSLSGGSNASRSITITVPAP